MARFDYDLFVIGAGSGGVRAARMAAGFGARVGVAEERYMGGTCVNAGCVPKKLLVYGSELGELVEDARAYGHAVEHLGFDWKKLVEAKDREIARLEGIYERLLVGSGVTVHRARARLVDPHTVEVDGKRLTAERILVATGARPALPDVPGAELGITSDEAFHLDRLPTSIAIVGAGYIGVEFAGIFRGLGSTVHLVQRAPHVLRHFDSDIEKHLEAELRKKGIHVHLGHAADRFEKTPSGVRMHCVGGGTIDAEVVMHATGRRPNTRGLGLEELGVVLRANGGIAVDERFVSSVPSILAVGDVIGRHQLTPVALAEGMWLARTLYGGLDLPPLDYRVIPTAVFSQPQVGTVGLTEQEARESHEVTIFRTTFTPMKHTLTGRDAKTMMKLVVDRRTDEVLGVHVVGPDAGEIVQGFAVALTCRATKAQLDATIGIHPTAAEELVTMRTPVPD